MNRTNYIKVRADHWTRTLGSVVLCSILFLGVSICVLFQLAFSLFFFLFCHAGSWFVVTNFVLAYFPFTGTLTDSLASHVHGSTWKFRQMSENEFITAKCKVTSQEPSFEKIGRFFTVITLLQLIHDTRYSSILACSKNTGEILSKKEGRSFEVLSISTALW